MSVVRRVPLGGEPVFDALQRAHPDVTVVLLPGADPAAGGAPAGAALAHDQTLQVERAVADAAQRLLSDLPGTTAGSGHRTTAATWERLSGPADGASHRCAVRVTVSEPDPEPALALLRALRTRLRRDGWGPAPVEAPRPRMTARSADGDLRLEAGLTPASVEVVVTSAPHSPDPQRLDDLRAARHPRDAGGAR